MQYRFTKDIQRAKKGQILSESEQKYFFLADVFDLMLHTGILEEVKEHSDPLYPCANKECPVCNPVKEEEWPKVGDEYFCIRDEGGVSNSCSWDDMPFEVNRKNFLGIYRTKEEAEKARDDVREFIRNRK